MRSTLHHWLFLAKGISCFEDSIYSCKESACIASYFEVQKSEQVSLGNVVAIDKDGKKVYCPKEYWKFTRYWSGGFKSIFDFGLASGNFTERRG